MDCVHCNGRAIITGPARCKRHFIEEFEARVQKTIEEFDLIREGQRIAVAASGGKDSLTLLFLLKKWHADVCAIAIDEGIAGYREHSLADLRRMCERLDVPLIVKSYEEYAGATLDSMLSSGSFNPCTLCGTFRRHLLSIASREFDVLATGHNADDEAQTVLMNLLRGNVHLFLRGGPRSGIGASGFTQRVKPLYFCSEKEIMTYAYLHGFVASFSECPNAALGYRSLVREALNDYAQHNPGVKLQMLERFLAMKQEIPERMLDLPSCESCGEPSANAICKACEMLEKVQEA